MNDKSERMRILEMIENGRITAQEGLNLLKALNEAGEAEPGLSDGAAEDELPAPDLWSGAAAGPITAISPGETFGQQEPLASLAPPDLPDPVYPADTDTAEPWQPEAEVEVIEPDASRPQAPADAAKWRMWWTLPLWVGLVVILWGGLFMYWSYWIVGGLSLLFLCAAAPFAIGLLLIAIGLYSRSAHWLHLRVQQSPGEKPERIAISMPLPIRPAAWFLRTFGDRLPNIRETNVDEILLAVGKHATPENPIYIQVDEGEGGDKVEIYIG